MNQSVQIFIYQLINENPDMSRFSISLCEKKNSDVSGFLFINWIFKIWTCPDFISGRVQIWNFWWKILNLDLSEFQFRTRPDFFFSIENLKSGLVQISILDFRFYPPYFWLVPLFCIDFSSLANKARQLRTSFWHNLNGRFLERSIKGNWYEVTSPLLISIIHAAICSFC